MMIDWSKVRTVLLALIVVLVFCWVVFGGLSGCTFTGQETQPDSKAHASTMPAVQICILAACDGQWADRTQRAGDDAESETGDTIADQEASSTPTLHIPVAGGQPLKIPLPTTTSEVMERVGPILERGRLPAMQNFGDEDGQEPGDGTP